MLTRIVGISITALVIGAGRNDRRNESPLLIEFAYVDSEVEDRSPVLEDCGYYFQMHGVIGHSGAFRPGASVRRQGDSLLILVDNYRWFDIDLRDWQMARWTLRVGGLEDHSYHVQVWAGRHRMSRQLRPSFGTRSCAA